MFFEQQPRPSKCPSCTLQDCIHSLPPLPLIQKTPSSNTETHFECADAHKKSKQAGQPGGAPRGGTRGVTQKVAPRELRRKVAELEARVTELERQNAQLIRNQYECRNCRRWLPETYISEGTQTRMEEETPDGGSSPHNRSADSIQFQQIDLHSPLLRTPGMEQKMWIFLGVTLLAMGSQAASWDGSVSSFKVLKGAVDDLRRQVQRCEKKVSLDVFCSKQQMNSNSFVDGINSLIDPFYAEIQEYHQGLQLQNIRLQAVDPHGLYYDSKYRYSINYQALLTIMQYSKDYCNLA